MVPLLPVRCALKRLAGRHFSRRATTHGDPFDAFLGLMRAPKSVVVELRPPQSPVDNSGSPDPERPVSRFNIPG